MVQHYVETISEPHHVKAVSPNTLLWINDSTYVMAQITWELTLKELDDQTCELSCKVVTETENAALAQQAHASNQNLGDQPTPLQQHIAEETPLFARDIERKARDLVWG